MITINTHTTEYGTAHIEYDNSDHEQVSSVVEGMLILNNSKYSCLIIEEDGITMVSGIMFSDYIIMCIQAASSYAYENYTDATITLLLTDDRKEALEMIKDATNIDDILDNEN